MRAGLDLWERHAAYGIYNIINPGAVTTRQLAEQIQRILKPDCHFEFGEDEGELFGPRFREPCSNYILDVSKLLATGVKMRPAREALEDAVRKWRAATWAFELQWN